MRYYHLWYARPPWSNWGLSYQIDLYPQDDDGIRWQAQVSFGYRDDIPHLLRGVAVYPGQRIESNRIQVDVGTDTLNDEEFARRIADVVRNFIERITPIIDDVGNEISD